MWSHNATLKRKWPDPKPCRAHSQDISALRMAFSLLSQLTVAMENGVPLRSGTGGEPMLRTSRGSRDALSVRTASKAKDP